MSTMHPVFWIMAVAVLAPLLAEVPVGFRVPWWCSRSCWGSCWDRTGWGW